MAMSGSGGGSELNSEINVTPMVDIMLVMLIIFMVVTPLLQSGVNVAIPKGLNPDEEGDITNERAVVVSIPFAGAYYIGRDPVNKDDLVETIKNRMKLRRPDEPQAVYIRGGVGVPYGDVVDVINSVRDAGFPVVPVPGANAAVAAVSAAGLAAERFVFVGFLPATLKARRELFEAFRALPVALVVYESPRRVRATVAAIAQALGGERTLVIVRELTKQFETIARMPLAEATTWLAADANRERGEFVLLVDAAPDVRVASADGGPVDARALLVALLAELPPTKAARIAAQVTGKPRDALYAEALSLKGN